MPGTPLLKKVLGQQAPPFVCWGGLPSESERPADIIRENAQAWGEMTIDSLFQLREQARNDAHFSLTQEGSAAAEEAISFKCAIQYYHAQRVDEAEGAGAEHHNNQDRPSR